MWLFCVRAAAWKRVVEIAETEVSVTSTSTAGREAWQEPLAAYRGVAPLDVLIRNEGRERQIAAVALDHEDKTAGSFFGACWCRVDGVKPAGSTPTVSVWTW